MGKSTNVIGSVFERVKHGIEYTAQFLRFVVTLGYYPFPSAKSMQPLETSSKDINTRGVTHAVNQEEANLLNFLSQDQKVKFLQSSQYFEYQKNPFNSINTFYQEFRAKSDLDAYQMGYDRRFLESLEYQNFLKDNPLNPFALDIRKLYEAYIVRTKSENTLKSQRKFEEDLEDFFDKLPQSEESFRVLFRESDVLVNVRTAMDITKVKEAYEKYKADLIKKTEDLRTKTQQELDKFTSDLKASPIFEVFSQSPEYVAISKNPFNTIHQIQSALEDFQKRIFWESLSMTARKRFEDSGDYQEISTNPFSSASDFEKAYKNFEAKRVEEYIDELKEQIGEQEFEKFIQSSEYLNPERSNTEEDIKVAYEEFKGKSSSWWFSI